MKEKAEQPNNANLADKTQSLVKPEPVWIQAIRKRANGNVRHPLKLQPDTENPEKLTVDCSAGEMICRIYETTGFLDDDAAEHLTYQVANVNTRGSDQELDATNASLAIMNGIAPESPLEGLLAAQMTVTHNMAMEFSRRAMREGQTTDGVDRNINRTTKMMKAFTSQVEALQKLRNKGQQKITVQHVQVNQGGQAVIGDINQGGGKEA